ncbi:hypothetical protein GCM10010885_17340 [Alicyclobacillus cellulosilyticus]|uniref:SAF domain-containing protein n=1 Tax=Alicyclobacillus cellulosilyticus TaxID=1003997 RepID=A0A917NL59_9BACL|nr:UxaA family hydrolase [Alicyclobacillus cellulosilyticus]GGJ08731.1 hypothetical protein GCM10010885_17340 [Alicyclobacillus cellulosilyticus]
MAAPHAPSGRAFLQMHPDDDVAIALTELARGTEIADPDGRFRVVLQDDIPFGHKFAIRPIAKGQPVRKYGQVIGAASRDIAPGEHAHVHNIESLRGRGDLARHAGRIQVKGGAGA